MFYEITKEEEKLIIEQSIKLCRAIPLLETTKNGSKVIDLITYNTLKRLGVINFKNKKIINSI